MVAYIAEIVTVAVTMIVIAWIVIAMVFPIAMTAARMTLAATNSKRQLERGWRFFSRTHFHKSAAPDVAVARLGRRVAASDRILSGRRSS
jgi:hypothetical protein